MRATRLILLGTIAWFALLLPGCYTVLHHPSEVTMTIPHDGGAEDIPCSSCHYESESLGYFDHQLIWGWPGLAAYDGYRWWDDYYQRPWWYENYWSDYGRYSESDGAGTGRSTWDRRDLRRGESPSDPPSGGVYPGAPSPPPATGTTASPSSGSTESKTAPEPEPTHGKKDPRR